MSHEEPFDLQKKFPNLRPIKNSPTLSTVNGLGCGVYGGRDHDRETGTYVKTHCVCVLFIPLIALGAYRVADAPNGGWYFLGKEPLSGFAKLWNRLLLGGGAIAACIIGWFAYTDTPEYKAKQRLAVASDYVAQEKYTQAADEYFSVAQGKSKLKVTAISKLSELLTHLESQPENEAYPKVLQMAVTLSRSALWPENAEKLIARQQPVINKLAKTQPSQALAVLDLLEPIVPDAAAHQTQRLALLERVVAAHPNDVDLVSQLAVILDEKGDLERCQKLLEPISDKLEGKEGARILGQIWARTEKQAEARDLLAPYVRAGMPELQQAEKDYDTAIETFSDQVVAGLNRNEAPESFYQAYKAADEAGKQQLVDDYIRERMRNDNRLKDLAKNLGRFQPVVFAALDLGMVQLRLAQDEPDQAKRKTQLEEAEQTFVSIRNSAGQEDQFRLYLGQVYYWLGKEKEGRALFDELLASHERDHKTLVGVSEMLRHLGAMPDARTLAEEAYSKGANDNEKYEAAAQLALMTHDRDDRITWLERSDPKDKEVQATLASTKSRKLASEGKLDEAAAEMSKSIDLYNAMPETATTLNNSALCYLERFSMTGNKADLDEGLKRIEKAVKLEASDSILVANAADVITSAALAELIGDKIDLNQLKLSGSVDLLGYLYSTDAEQQKLLQRMRTSPAILKSLDYLQRAMLMAPKRATAYATAAGIYEVLEDQAALEKVSAQMIAAAPNVADQEEKLREYYAGTDRDQERLELNVGIEEARKTLAAAKEQQGPTFAVAATRLAQLLMHSGRLGGTCDADEVVQLSEQAHAAAKSVSTYSALYDAYLYRACDQLSKQDATFKAAIEKCRDALTEEYLGAFILAEGGEMADKLKQHPDTIVALERAKERMAAVDETPGIWYWAMLKNIDSALAESVAAKIRADKALLASTEIWTGLNRTSAAGIVQSYWLATIQGQREKGVTQMQAFAAEGVPLPVDLLAK